MFLLWNLIHTPTYHVVSYWKIIKSTNLFILWMAKWSTLKQHMYEIFVFMNLDARWFCALRMVISLLCYEICNKITFTALFCCCWCCLIFRWKWKFLLQLRGNYKHVVVLIVFKKCVVMILAFHLGWFKIIYLHLCSARRYFIVFTTLFDYKNV